MEEESGKPRGGVVETRAETDTGGPEVVRFWREQIRLAGEEEKRWREVALDAVKTYEGDANEDKQRFNVLYSNMETLAPSVYNSAPIPDIRRRYNEGGPVDLVASQSLERAISYFLDVYDFDAEMMPVVLDGLLVGRGVARVRYEPQMDAMGGMSGIEVHTEHVHWEDYRQSPAGQWRDVRWVAYRHLFTREQLVRLNPEIGGQVNLGVAVDGQRDKEGQPKNIPDIYKRSICWEIWDRERREVLFISDDWSDSPIAQVPDPYGLKDFWPQPKPYYDVMSSTSLKPVCPYAIYKAQARELDKVSRRIMSLAAAVKMAGVAAGQADFLKKLQDADDGVLVPISDIDMQGVLSSGAGDLSRIIWMWPIDKTVAVLRELISYRETIKATIYEITGISDIIRGATNPNETLGAQQLKSQWGSLRLQRRQKDVQRMCRDLVRIKAELISEKMPIEQLAQISNITLPTAEEKAQAQQVTQLAQQLQQAMQAGEQIPPEMQSQVQQAAAQAQEVLPKPTWDDVHALLSQDAMRCYRVDIETDSTIREDVTRSQQQLSQFVMSIGQLMQGALPVMQAKPDMVPVILATLKATARTFKLGRELEDAIEKVGPDISPPQPPQPPQEDPREAREADEQEAERNREHERQMQGMTIEQEMQDQQAQQAQQMGMQPSMGMM